MKIKEVIESILEIKGVSKTDLANRIDITRASLSERIRRENIGMDKLNQMLKALDYKIIVVPRNRRLGENEFDFMTESKKVVKEANKDNKDNLIYDLWLKRSDLSVEEYTAELNKIWPDDSKKVSKEFERYMKWYMEEKLNK